MPAPRNESSLPVSALRAGELERCVDELELGQRRLEVELAAEPHARRHLLEQLVDRVDADRGEHLLAVGVGQREVAGRAHCSASTAR